MASLPQFVVLKSTSNGKYLRYAEEPNGGATYLKFCGDKIFSLDAKFEIKLQYAAPANQGCSQAGLPRRGPTSHAPSQPGHADRATLVHIRCCYNNRFLRVDDNWIVPEAEEPETDKSNPSCTLFVPILEDDNTGTFQFCHVQLQRRLSIDRNAAHALSVDPTIPVVRCEVIDLDSLFRLPRRVLFKDDRGYYLRCYDRRYIQFAENVNRAEGTVINDVFVTGDGYVRIKSHFHGRFWRCEPESKLICADYDVDPNGGYSDDALFLPVDVGNNTIALRNKRTNWFCRRVTYFWERDRLGVARDGFVKKAHLVVEEPLMSSRITNVQFRLGHARIINKNLDMIVCTKRTENRSSTEKITQELNLSYELEKSSTWSSSNQSKSGFKTTFTAGIPNFVNGNLEISNEASHSIQWGNTESKKVQVASKVTVNVNPRTIAVASVSATKVLLEVPFSYTPCDTLPGSNDDSDNIEDGVYRFVTWLDIKDYTDDEPMDPTRP